MNKKIIKEIEKRLKKDKTITISYNPTLEEVDYLNNKGVNITHRITTCKGIVSGWPYPKDYLTYSIDI